MGDLAESSALPLNRFRGQFGYSIQLFIEAEQAAYHESAVADEAFCERMHERRLRFTSCLNETGLRRSLQEDGMMPFHAFLRWELEPHLKWLFYTL